MGQIVFIDNEATKQEVGMGLFCHNIGRSVILWSQRKAMFHKIYCKIT